MRREPLIALLMGGALLAMPPLLSAASQASTETQREHPGEAKEKEAEIKTLPITIEGLEHLDVDSLYDVLGVKYSKWFEFWKEKNPRIPLELIPSIQDTLRGYLDSKGYYDATYTVKVDKKGVTIVIDEKKPVVVEEINVSSDFPIGDYISFEKGDPFETDTFTSVKSRIKKALLKEGYCSYDLDTKAYVDLDKRTVDLVYRLKKGDLCHFGNTTVVSKPEDIRDAVILSRMRYRPGDVFTTERVNESYAALNQLGIFGQTLINTDIKYFNVVRPEVSAKYKEHMHRYTISAGYDTEVGMRVRGTYDHYNFFGGGRKLGLVAQYSSEVIELSSNFFQPALFEFSGLYFDLYLDGGYYQEAYDFYDEKKVYFDAKINHIDGFWDYSLGFSVERLNIVKTGTPPPEEEDSFYPGYFSLVYGYGELAYDGRDSKLNPRNGYYLKGYGEFGYSMGEGEVEDSMYYKWILEAHLIKSFGLFTFATVGHAGVIYDEKPGSLPMSKYFYAGGSYSNRAYGDRDIGVTITPTSDWGGGGRTWLNFTAEMQYPIWGDLYGGIFYDATMIAMEDYDFKGEAWIQSAGLGARYITPVGPIKLDFGMNIHDPSINRISIMIGQSF